MDDNFQRDQDSNKSFDEYDEEQDERKDTENQMLEENKANESPRFFNEKPKPQVMIPRSFTDPYNYQRVFMNELEIRL